MLNALCLRQFLPSILYIMCSQELGGFTKGQPKNVMPLALAITGLYTLSVDYQESFKWQRIGATT